VAARPVRAALESAHWSPHTGVRTLESALVHALAAEPPVKARQLHRRAAVVDAHHDRLMLVT